VRAGVGIGGEDGELRGDASHGLAGSVGGGKRGKRGDGEGVRGGRR